MKASLGRQMDHQACLTLVVSCIFKIPSTMSETLLVSSCMKTKRIIINLEEGHGFMDNQQCPPAILEQRINTRVKILGRCPQRSTGGPLVPCSEVAARLTQSTRTMALTTSPLVNLQAVCLSDCPSKPPATPPPSREVHLETERHRGPHRTP